MCNSFKSMWSLVTCRTSCSVTQAYGPLTVTHRYPFATKPLTGVPGEYPSEGKSFAQVVQVRLKPITEATNNPIIITSPIFSWTGSNVPAYREARVCTKSPSSCERRSFCLDEH